MLSGMPPGGRIAGAARGKIVITLLAFFLLAGIRVQAGNPSPVGVVSEKQTLDGTTPYSTNYGARQGNCSVTLIAYTNEPGVVKYQPDCRMSLAGQLPLLRQVFSTYLAKDPNAAKFRTLFWGRVAPDWEDASREMSLRLAAAAFRSDQWDKESGRPKNGDINGFVRDLANKAMIYPELEELFSGFKMAVTLRHAEKVLVLEAGKLPIFPGLAELGAGPMDRLPFDFMAWFAVVRDVQ